MNIVYCGLGSNFGDRKGYLDLALTKLDEDNNIEVVSVSSIYETKPFGINEQPDYLNSCVKIFTKYSVDEFHKKIKQLEKDIGRIVREKWGAREIDIDILLFNDLILDTHELRIPHAGITERDFVLIPLLELEPEVVHPQFGKLKNIDISKLEKYVVKNISV